MKNEVMQNKFVFAFLKAFLFPLMSRLVKKVEGKENIPKKGQFIIAANHINYFDPLIIYSIFARKIRYKVHFMTSNKAKWVWNILGGEKFLMWAVGMIPTPEWQCGKPKVPSINNALKVLKAGGVVGIFPFPRSHPKDPMTIKTGVARLTLWTNVPVIPVAIKGTYAILGNRLYFPKTFKRLVRVRIGKPMAFDEYAKRLGKSREKDGQVFREVADKITDKILLMDKSLR